MTQEALRMALEALEVATTPLAKDRQEVLRAITAIKEALVQEQEPVANDPLPRACNRAGVDYQTFLKIKAYMPVAPPQRSESSGKPSAWVGLTDEERSQLVTLHHGWNEYGQAIEAKLKEKNT
jgi:hypothetical protein